jgi:hypothetical protein
LASTPRRQIRRQGADEHVGLPLDLADLRLSDPEVGSQLNLRQTCCSAYRGKIDHRINITLKKYYFKGILIVRRSVVGGLRHERRRRATDRPAGQRCL